MNKKERWLAVGSADSIPVRAARLIITSFGPIALFRANTNEFFALDDRCPHKAGPLSQGIVHGYSVTCPLHNLVVDLRSGIAEGPDGGCAKSFPVEERDGELFIEISALEQMGVA